MLIQVMQDFIISIDKLRTIFGFGYKGVKSPHYNEKTRLQSGLGSEYYETYALESIV